MATLQQAFMLGTDRLAAPPIPPHPALAPAWQGLDWINAREEALLDAVALAGTARTAGAQAESVPLESEACALESQPFAPAAAAALLPQLLAGDWRALLPEWLEHCAQHGRVIPPFYLRRVFEAAGETDRVQVRRVAGKRGRWLARQNPAWSWVHAAAAVAGAGSAEAWTTGTPDERLAWFRGQREIEPEAARAAMEKTWAEEDVDFRLRLLEILRLRLASDDEPLLTRLLKERRKEIRTAAQGLLAILPGSALARRMKERSPALLVIQRGILGRKLEVTLPAAFDSVWREDALEEKAPAGVGEKAFWTQQILALVPVGFWAEKSGLDPERLVELAAKSGDWAELLLGAWCRSAILHHDHVAAAALLPRIQTQARATAGGAIGPAVTALLAICTDADRWRFAGTDVGVAWPALPLLTGDPGPGPARAVLAQLAPGLRGGFNPGGSPQAVLAARRLPLTLRDEAVQLLAREQALSKPAETFLQALDLRVRVAASFSSPS